MNKNINKLIKVAELLAQENPIFIKTADKLEHQDIDVVIKDIKKTARKLANNGFSIKYQPWCNHCSCWRRDIGEIDLHQDIRYWNLCFLDRIETRKIKRNNHEIKIPTKTYEISIYIIQFMFSETHWDSKKLNYVKNEMEKLSKSEIDKIRELARKYGWIDAFNCFLFKIKSRSKGVERYKLILYIYLKIVRDIVNRKKIACFLKFFDVPLRFLLYFLLNRILKYH